MITCGRESRGAHSTNTHRSRSDRAEALLKLKKALEITLGIITSIGGFLDVGMIATASQAGALFGLCLVKLNDVSEFIYFQF